MNKDLKFVSRHKNQNLVMLYGTHDGGGGLSVQAIVFCPAYFIAPAYLADAALWKYPTPFEIMEYISKNFIIYFLVSKN